jgi:hypothetical protein
MGDDEPGRGGIVESLMFGCMVCVLGVIVAIGLFFGICSIVR